MRLANSPRTRGRIELVNLNSNAASRGTFEPGWRWPENVKPLAGTDSCQVEHIGPGTAWR